MSFEPKLKKYNKKEPYSYSFGAFPTIELLKNQPETVQEVLIHRQANENITEHIYALCYKNNIPLIQNDRTIEKIQDKENCFVVGVFNKFSSSLNPLAPHIMLVNPGDMGNLGTIIRTAIGFGIRDLAIIEPSADIFHPKTIRASMGSFFRLNFQMFSDFESYQQKFEYTSNNISNRKKRLYYPFMLNGVKQLGTFCHPKESPFTLIFGNESSGLTDDYLNIGTSVKISHSSDIDSLNLSLATGIGIYEFTRFLYSK